MAGEIEMGDGTNDPLFGIVQKPIWMDCVECKNDEN